MFCFLQMLSGSLFYGSTAFLIGPKRQVTMMLDPVRIYATAIYIASMIIALFCALYVSQNASVLYAINICIIWYLLDNTIIWFILLLLTVVHSFVMFKYFFYLLMFWLTGIAWATSLLRGPWFQRSWFHALTQNFRLYTRDYDIVCWTHCIDSLNILAVL